MSEINVDVTLPNATSVDVTSPTQALSANVFIAGPQGPVGTQGPSGATGARGAPTTINSLTGENIIISGANGNIVVTSGFSTIYISGNSGYFQSQVNILTNNLNSTGANLNTSINNLSGLFTGYTGNLDNNYATDAQLANTGSTLNTKIDNLSGYVNSQDSNISNNLASTGSSLQSNINTLSSNLSLTGSNLNDKINSLSGTLTGNYLTTNSASSTYATITNLNSTGNTLNSNISALSGTLTSNYATINNLALTGSNLNTKIDNFSGTYQNFVNNLDASYATDVQLENTGSTLSQNINNLSGTLTNNYYLKSNPSGFITGVDLTSYLTSSSASSTYATIINLASTGSTLTSSINSLNSAFTGFTGNLDTTYATDSQLISTGSTLVNSISSLSGTLTSNYATINDLNSTGSTLEANIASTGNTLNLSINSLSGTLTSDYATIINLASTGSNLQTQINNLDNIYATDTSVTTVLNNLASTGSTLNTKINSLSGDSVLLYGNQSVGGIKTFRDNVYINNLFVTGTETIVSTNNFNVQSPYLILNLTGGAVDGGIFFVTGSGLTGVNDSGPIIGFDHVNKFKFGISTRNSDLSTLPDIASVQNIQEYSGFVDGKYSTISNLASTGSTLNNNINSLSGYVTGQDSIISNNLSSTGLALINNINSLSGQTVFKTGDQVIFGQKIFTGSNTIIGNDLYVYGSGYFPSGIKIGTSSVIINDTSVLVNSDPVVLNAQFTGFSGDIVATFATISNLALTGIALDNKITSLSGTLTGNYLTINSAASTYATIPNLSLTGATLLTTINSFSGLFTGYTGSLDSTFASDMQLANTGSTLDNKINNLSGVSVLTFGNQNITGNKTFINNITVSGTGTFNAIDLDNIDNLSLSGVDVTLTNSIVNVAGNIFISGNQVLTGVNLTPYATTANLALTGSTLDTKINSLSGTLTGNYLTTSLASNTYATISNLASTGSTLVTNLASTGSTLDTKINNLSGYINSTSSNIVFTTGNQNIAGNKTFTGVVTFSGQEVNIIDTALNLSGLGDMTFSGTNINFINSPVFISGTNLRVIGDVLGNNLVYNTGNQIISGIKTFDVFPIVSGNRLITGVDLSSYLTSSTASSTYSTITNLALTGSTLQTNINNLSNTYATITNVALTGSTLDTKINNVSGYINSTSSNIVFTTGNQTISGTKTFIQDTTFGDSTQGDFLVISGNNFTVYGSGNFTSGLFVNGNAVLTGVNLSSYATVANLASTGSILDSKINSLSGNLTANYATITNLASTGSTLDTKINNVSGYAAPKDIATTINISSNTISLDLSTFSYFLVNLNSNITTTNFNNPKAAPEVTNFVLQLSGDGTIRSVTWPTSLRWPGSTAPTITIGPNKVDTYSIFSYDGGISYYGFPAGYNS